MNVSLGQRWETFVDEALKAGRYASASEVVREGLRLIEEREAKLDSLRETINASIARGGKVSDAAVAAHVAAALADLTAKG